VLKISYDDDDDDDGGGGGGGGYVVVAIIICWKILSNIAFYHFHNQTV
jgi:hypothetical protein